MPNLRIGINCFKQQGPNLESFRLNYSMIYLFIIVTAMKRQHLGQVKLIITNPIH